MKLNQSAASIQCTVQRVQKGIVAPDQPARQALLSVQKQDETLKAWAFSAGPADLAALSEREARGGLLAGVPFGVKDIINVAGMPTRCGSPAYNDTPAQFDAACVLLLRAAGAVPIGKTVTAEFAYMSPGLTRNPVNTDYTPGGSSSGSAAAVASGMVPFALGTQTGGSVIRPAAFCGIVGFKPTFGSVHRDGMKITCDSLDTIGWHTRSVDDAALVARVLLSQPKIVEEIKPLNELKIAYLPRMPEHSPDTEATDALGAAKTALQAAGVRVETIAALPVFKLLLDAHATIIDYEFSRSLAPVARHYARVLSKPLLDAVVRGMSIPTSQYIDMKQLQSECCGQWQTYFSDADLILTAGAPGPAPKGILTTGSSVFNRIWTLLGWPCLQLPTSVSGDGLPLGVQFVGKPNADMQVLYWGALLHNRVAAPSSASQGSQTFVFHIS